MLDVHLPDATGFQTCGRLREDPRTKAIPIIMMTGAARWPNQQAIGRQLGANEYLLKPFDVDRVTERVRSLIGEPHGAGHTNGSTPHPVITENVVRLPLPEEAPPEELPRPAHPAEQEPWRREQPVVPAPNPLPLEVARDPEPVRAPEAPRRVAILPPDPAFLATRRQTAYRSLSADTAAIAPAGAIVAHLLVQALQAERVGESAALLAVGWAVLLSAFVATAGVLRIPLEARQALRLLGWAAVPMVGKALLGWIVPFVPVDSPLAFLGGAFFISSPESWPMPDLFDAGALAALLWTTSRLPGASRAKIAWTAVALASVWLFAVSPLFSTFDGRPG
jgi:CheY-like chemotaxis protein